MTVREKQANEDRTPAVRVAQRAWREYTGPACRERFREAAAARAESIG
jgi:hypothetical protein